MSEIHDKQKTTILNLLTEKSVMKQDVFSNTISVFKLLKEILQERANDLESELSKVDKRVSIVFKENGPQSIQLKVAGDMLDFHMHSNVFEFEPSHPMFKTGYIKNNNLNSYCGIINVYNFLADSFKFNRLNDLGYLIARIFINREKKFFIETKTQIGHRYSNFSNDPLTKETLTEIINELIIFAVSFDLFTPPYEIVKSVTVAEIQELQSANALRTGKRLGYIAGSYGSSEDEVNL